MTEKLPDGFYPDLDFSTYLAQGRLSKSVLLAHRKSGAHALHAMTAETEPTAAMRAGTLAHTLILEPDTFASRYAVGPVSDRRLKAWKEWTESLDAESDKRERLTPAEYEAGKGMAAWLNRKPTIAKLIRRPGPVEASVLWTDTDPMTGLSIPFRGRPDKLIESLGILLDVKTTTDLSDRALAKKVQDMGYHVQAALYAEGLASVGRQVDHAVLLFVESNPPYEARALLLSEDWMEAARGELRLLKARHYGCMAANSWPGYADMVEDMEAPVWLRDSLGVAA